MLKMVKEKVKAKKQESTVEVTISVNREQLVAETAYFLAEKRGFEPGHEIEDWATAEKLVDSGTSRVQ